MRGHASRLAGLFLSGCTGTTSPSAIPGSAGQVASPPAAAPLTLAVATVCNVASCSGEQARIVVWRDDQNQPKILEHRGSFECSHPPTGWYNLSGEALLVQPERPVTDPEDAAALQAERDAITGALQKAETLSCPQ